MFKTAIATLMMLAPAGAQYLGNHSANPYAPHAAASPYAPDSSTSPYSRPSSTASPYAPPKMYGSPRADARQLPLPYDPDALNTNRFVYSPDGTRNPYGAGNPYSPTTSTNPYGSKLRAPGND